MPNIEPRPTKAVTAPNESVPIPIVPIQDGVIVCIDKKANRHVWRLLEDIKYCGMPLKEYLERQEKRILELEKQVKKLTDQSASIAKLAVVTAERGVSEL